MTSDVGQKCAISCICNMAPCSQPSGRIVRGYLTTKEAGAHVVDLLTSPICLLWSPSIWPSLAAPACYPVSSHPSMLYPPSPHQTPQTSC